MKTTDFLFLLHTRTAPPQVPHKLNIRDALVVNFLLEHTILHQEFIQHPTRELLETLFELVLKEHRGVRYWLEKQGEEMSQRLIWTMCRVKKAVTQGRSCTMRERLILFRS